MSQPEARLSRAIRVWLEKQGYFAFKVHGGPTMMAGLPDLVAVVHGRFLGIESKMPGNKPSLRQKYVHGLIERAGGVVVVAYSLEDVQNAVQRIAGSVTRGERESRSASRTDARIRHRYVINNAIEEWVRLTTPEASVLHNEDQVKELSRFIRDQLQEAGYGKLAGGVYLATEETGD